MTAAANRAVAQVHADLAVEVDGRPVTITADGRDVLVEVSDPGHLIDVVAGIPRPVGSHRVLTRSTLRQVADTGAQQGLTLTVTGPDGVLVALGAGARSNRWLRLAVGTENVSFGSRKLLWAAIWPSVVPALRRARLTAARRFPLSLDTVARRIRRHRRT